MSASALDTHDGDSSAGLSAQRGRRGRRWPAHAGVAAGRGERLPGDAPRIRTRAATGRWTTCAAPIRRTRSDTGAARPARRAPRRRDPRRRLAGLRLRYASGSQRGASSLPCALAPSRLRRTPLAAGTRRIDADRVAKLEAEVQAAEDVSAIKRLQRTYGYYVDKGMWTDLAEYFTDDAVANYPAGVFIGKASIREHLYRNVGNVPMGRWGWATTVSTTT